MENLAQIISSMFSWLGFLVLTLIFTLFSKKNKSKSEKNSNINKITNSSEAKEVGYRKSRVLK